MTMAIDQEPDVNDLDDEQELGDHEGADDEPDEDEDDEADDSGDTSDDEGDDAEGGGGEPAAGDDKPAGEPVVALTGRALVEALFNDEDAKGTLADALSEYQRQLDEQAASKEEAEKFQKLIEDEDYEGIGKIIIERQREEAARSTVTEAVTQEVFNPVYRKLFAQPEMQDLTAEDKEKLHLSKFENHADHVAAIQDFISTKRAKSNFDEAVKKGVEEALLAEKNKASAVKAKGPSLAGRAPVSAGTATGATSSASLLKSGLRALINPDDSGDDDE